MWFTKILSRQKWIFLVSSNYVWLPDTGVGIDVMTLEKKFDGIFDGKRSVLKGVIRRSRKENERH